MHVKHKHSEEPAYEAIRNGELEIDAEGRVWRLLLRHGDRWRGGSRLTTSPRRRAENPTPDGYLQVRVQSRGKRSCAAAHRLVWLHFKGPIPDGMTINHRNGIKSDNRPENLELATYAEQRIHAVRSLGAKHADVRGSRHPRARTDEETVAVMRRRRASGESVKALAEEFRMSPKAVSAICRRRTWKHVP